MITTASDSHRTPRVGVDDLCSLIQIQHG